MKLFLAAFFASACAAQTVTLTNANADRLRLTGNLTTPAGVLTPEIYLPGHSVVTFVMPESSSAYWQVARHTSGTTYVLVGTTATVSGTLDADTWLISQSNDNTAAGFRHYYLRAGKPSARSMLSDTLDAYGFYYGLLAGLVFGAPFLLAYHLREVFGDDRD